MLGRQGLLATKRGRAPISEVWAHVPVVAHNRASESRPALLFAANVQFGDLRRGEGYYYPIRGWAATAGIITTSRTSSRWPTVRTKVAASAWPIRFSRGRDPFTHPEIGALHNTPLPPPPADYVPPPDLGRALRSFFPGYAFNDKG